MGREYTVQGWSEVRGTFYCLVALYLASQPRSKWDRLPPCPRAPMKNPSAASLLPFWSFFLSFWSLGRVQQGCSIDVDRIQASCDVAWAPALRAASLSTVASLPKLHHAQWRWSVWGDLLVLSRFHDWNDVKGKWPLVWPLSHPVGHGAQQESTRRNPGTWSQT